MFLFFFPLRHRPQPSSIEAPPQDLSPAITTPLQQQPFQQQQQQAASVAQANYVNRLPTTSSPAAQQQPGVLPSTQPVAQQQQSNLPTAAAVATAFGTTTQVPGINSTQQQSYLKQQDQTSAYLGHQAQQHHLGVGVDPIAAPYSYMPNQPPSGLSAFGMGPLPGGEYGATLYGSEAQRAAVMVSLLILYGGVHDLYLVIYRTIY